MPNGKQIKRTTWESHPTEGLIKNEMILSGESAEPIRDKGDNDDDSGEKIGVNQ